MQPTRAQVEAYYCGFPQRIGEKILFIKRDPRLAEYVARLTALGVYVLHALTTSARRTSRATAAPRSAARYGSRSSQTHTEAQIDRLIAEIAMLV